MTSATLDAAGHPAKRAALSRLSVFAVGLTALSVSCTPAQAVDGCKVMLCLAAPKWRAIPACVPPIRQLFHDLGHGHSFPTCAIQGAGNSAANVWARAPDFCPPQYTHLLDVEPGPRYACDYTAAVSVAINGELFTRTWWNANGDSVTEFAPQAKAQLGLWDRQFDADYAKWLASPKAPAITEQP